MSKSSFGTEGWPAESILKEKYGYNVRKGTPIHYRHSCLKRAVEEGILDLKKIVNHIAAIIRIHKESSNPRFDDAIIKWEEDLEWLKEEYFNGSFQWPPTDNSMM